VIQMYVQGGEDDLWNHAGGPSVFSLSIRTWWLYTRVTVPTTLASWRLPGLLHQFIADEVANAFQNGWCNRAC